MRPSTWPTLATLLALLALAVLTGCPSSCEDERRDDPGVAAADPGGSEEGAEGDDRWSKARARMVREQMRDVDDPDVLEAMRSVPRHEFVPERLREEAYDDHPLPIGHDQTISQPYIVALMTQLAAVDEGDTILEVGTGSGYQAAVLAEMGVEVYTIEIVEPLAETARKRLERLGYDNVHVKHGDGYKGWPEHAPFDAVVVTAAPPKIPPPLKEQLKVGARLVIPVGERSQELRVLTRTEDGFEEEREIPVRFVPMTGQAQRESEE